MTGRRRAVLIAGPTASGKSALALTMAQAQGGVIVNTDSMQVYDTLRVVTARPSAVDEAMVPHRLYGSVPAGTRFSTGQWLNAVGEVIATTGDSPLIFVGGTGLYFDAMLNGFADIPEVPSEVIAQIQQEIQALDGAQRLALLQREDPEAAARLKVADPQRLIRALPAPLGARLLSAAIAKHAWTFAGSGAFTIVAHRPLTFEIAANPLAPGAAASPCCHWHAAVFERLFSTLVWPGGESDRNRLLCLRRAGLPVRASAAPPGGVQG